jgi:hypothetical protein
MTAGVRVLQKGLTLAGIAHAFALGTLLYGAFGAGGFSLLCLYFLFGTAVSGMLSCFALYCFGSNNSSKICTDACAVCTLDIALLAAVRAAGSNAPWLHAANHDSCRCYKKGI